MTDSNETAAAMQKMSRLVQGALSQYGDKLAMGTAPTVVVFQANVNPAQPDATRMWHAAIIYRQHVAPTPEVALASLGNTIGEAAAHLDMTERGIENTATVKEAPGGGDLLPDVWE